MVSKGSEADHDAYSGFEATDLDRELRARNVRRLWVGGLATDYCVLKTVRDALAKGYEVILLRDAIRPVEVRPGDGAHAENQMIRGGAIPLSGFRV